MLQPHLLDRTVSISSLPASNYSCSGSITPSSDTSSPASCPPSPRHQHHIFAAQIDTSSQDSVLPGSAYPYLPGNLQTKHSAGWNSVDTFEIRQGNTQKAVLISPSKFRFKLSRTTSPSSPTKSSHKRGVSAEQDSRETDGGSPHDLGERSDREVALKRVALVDRPVAFGERGMVQADVTSSIPVQMPSLIQKDVYARTSSGSLYIEVSHRE